MANLYSTDHIQVVLCWWLLIFLKKKEHPVYKKIINKWPNKIIVNSCVYVSLSFLTQSFHLHSSSTKNKKNRRGFLFKLTPPPNSTLLFTHASSGAER